MTKQEFESLAEKANLPDISEDLYEIVENTLKSIEILDDYDEENHGNK